MSSQALLTLLLSVEAELALIGHGTMLLLLEERNTAAARTCRVLPLVKQVEAMLNIISVEIYIAMNQSRLPIYGFKVIALNISYILLLVRIATSNLSCRNENTCTLP